MTHGATDIKALAEQAVDIMTREGGTLNAAVRKVIRRATRPTITTPDSGYFVPPPLPADPVDVVIPAFNEARTIRAIVSAFRDCPAIDAVIVVDDKSDDGTAAEARAAGALVIPGPGVGKGEAAMAGLTRVTSARVIFCDADLKNFTPYHAALLAQEYAGMIIGTFPQYPAINEWISGMRALPTALATATSLHGYAMEVELTFAARAQGLHIRKVSLFGADHRRNRPKTVFPWDRPRPAGASP